MELRDRVLCVMLNYVGLRAFACGSQFSVYHM